MDNNLLKTALLIGLGACLANEDVRKKTINAFNGLGKQAETMVGGFFKNAVSPSVETEDEQQSEEFV